jgi:hypothetical protein
VSKRLGDSKAQQPQPGLWKIVQLVGFAAVGLGFVARQSGVAFGVEVIVAGAVLYAAGGIADWLNSDLRS